MTHIHSDSSQKGALGHVHTNADKFVPVQVLPTFSGYLRYNRDELAKKEKEVPQVCFIGHSYASRGSSFTGF